MIAPNNYYVEVNNKKGCSKVSFETDQQCKRYVWATLFFEVVLIFREAIVEMSLENVNGSELSSLRHQNDIFHLKLSLLKWE